MRNILKSFLAAAVGAVIITAISSQFAFSNGANALLAIFGGILGFALAGPVEFCKTFCAGYVKIRDYRIRHFKFNEVPDDQIENAFKLLSLNKKSWFYGFLVYSLAAFWAVTAFMAFGYGMTVVLPHQAGELTGMALFHETVNIWLGGLALAIITPLLLLIKFYFDGLDGYEHKCLKKREVSVLEERMKEIEAKKKRALYWVIVPIHIAVWIVKNFSGIAICVGIALARTCSLLISGVRWTASVGTITGFLIALANQHNLLIAAIAGGGSAFALYALAKLAIKLLPDVKRSMSEILFPSKLTGEEDGMWT